MKPICEIDAFGTKRYLFNDNLHREDGPAVEYVSGTKKWFLNGLLHREDGPALEWAHSDKQWFYHGKHIDCKDNQEFLRIIKMIAFL